MIDILSKKTKYKIENLAKKVEFIQYSTARISEIRFLYLIVYLSFW